MSFQSKWPDEESDDYWSQNQQNPFNFDEEESNFVVINKSNSGAEKHEVHFSNSSKKQQNNEVIGSLSKKLDLRLPRVDVEKQVEKYLNSIEINEKPKTLTDDTSSKVSPKEMIDRMFDGQDVFLHAYKGKDEKLNLLDSAIESNDGNVITCVVLFLRNTLKPAIFNNELRKRPLAANHYAYYLQQTGRLTELADVLAMLGRHEEAAMMMYMQAISYNNVETKLRHLKSCLQSHFSSGGSDVTFWSGFIADQISLLERQLPIESDDARQQREGKHPLFMEIPRSPLINLPVITTLYYCCIYHYSLPENHFASPKSIFKLHKLSDKQFLWTALRALAKFNRWTDIDALFEYKSWLGNKKMKPSIPFNKVFILLKKNNAPEEVLVKYFDLINDDEMKLNLAKDFKMHYSAIEILIKRRDRKLLEEYASRLNSDSKELLYVNNALRSSTIKWKN